MAVALFTATNPYCEISMPINLDSYLGNLSSALQLRAKRAEVLASNLANADTPGYKARDFDFQKALGMAQGSQLSMSTTRNGHIPTSGAAAGGSGPDMQYRVPDSPALDGNTVDVQKEKGEFAQNAIQYQTTFTFLNGRIMGLKEAIRGE